MTTLTGTIDRILYQNTDNAWASVIIATKESTCKATGIMPGLRIGMTVRVSGEMESTRWGESLKAEEFIETRPDDIEGIEKYLASGLIKNIGPKFAKAIVETFGTDTLNILDNEPERLMEIHGVGAKRLRSVIEAVKDQKTIRSIMIWLKRYDLTNSLASKIYKQYGENSIAVLEENPYRLCDEMEGVGFKRADSVACRLGLAMDSPFRILSGIRACLQDAANEGHTCLPEQPFVTLAASGQYLGVDEGLVRNALGKSESPTVTVNGYVFLKEYYYAEKSIAENLRRILNGKTNQPFRTPDIAGLQQQTGVTYSTRQQEAITTAVTSKVSIITGGPGTGKTITTNGIIAEFDQRGLRVLLCAPTGRAAKRMTEVTDKEAMTIHRLLEYTPTGFGRNESLPLEGDAIIIDESSMIDTLLMKHLLKAIPDHMYVVIVGDVDQLPSVGAGCILRDLIDSGAIPTTHLTEIYRQAQGSDIIVNAHAVNSGRMPIIKNQGNTDFWFFGVEEKAKIAETIIELVSTKVPQKFGYKGDSIQVLTPMKKDADIIGSIQLNRSLQAVLNPSGEKVATKGETEFRVGDRVMQTKNDYDKGVFNGDLGVIVSKLDEQANEEKNIMMVRFDEQLVPLTRAELSNLDLAYACTIHKSQGSEYPVVIMPIHDSQFIMLKRNLLYTGITRAKRQCIIVGTRRAIAIACSNEDTRRRYTQLKEKIRQN